MRPIARKSIMVVDDNPDNLHLLMELLTDQGYRMRSAPSGERALASAQKEPPDLILLDILMPEMDGYEVCRHLKADERTRHIPVIFISALNEMFDKVSAFSVGGVDYITKPFQLEEVVVRVRTHLSLEEMRHSLHVQNQQLQDQNQELEAFAHTVAHDLKNPLSTLLGFLELAREDLGHAADRTHKLFAMSTAAGYKMFNIIDELLLLASVRKEDVEIGPVDMTATINHGLTRLTHMLEQYEPVIDVPDTLPAAQGYGPWIEEVWINYLSNGIKYGGKPPELKLGATPQADGTIRFWVWDNGAGLTPEAQSRLFTEFTRLDKVRAEGHGLGLSIVRRIMNRLGGQVGVESAPGEGSLFYFTLPANRSE
jgi:two-component system, sensor histidine kinase and response regulator